jgi:hypothetical protein
VVPMATPSEQENDLLFQMVRRDDLDFLQYIMSHDENALNCTSQTSGRHLLDYALEVASERMLRAMLRYDSLEGSLLLERRRNFQRHSAGGNEKWAGGVERR